MARQRTQQDGTPSSINFFGIHGRNGYDDPFTLPNDQCCEALNGDWYGAALGRRRGGAAELTTTGGTAFTGGIRFLCRHVPGSDQSAAEFWAIDSVGTVKRLVAGTVWANVTLDDPITGNFGEVNAVSFNGKLYLCYQSGQNRLHVWDPSLSLVRRVGIATAAAPTLAIIGGGVAGTIRYYKVRFVRQSGGVNVLQGELGPLVSNTPGGVNGDRITRPTAPGEHETHWQLFASADNTNYWLIATVAIGTTTFDDLIDPATYASVTGTVPPLAGSYLPPPAARYIVADTARLVMAGDFETSGGFVTASTSTVWWTSPLHSSDVGDDERISLSTAIVSRDDLGESILGLSPPQQGSFQALTYAHQWKYVATPSATAPYQRFIVAGGQGTISHKSVLVAHDDAGYPATYWISSRGIERYGRSGNQFVAVDISDIWNGDTSKALVGVNLDATTLPFGVYHQDIHQIWWWIAETGSNTPTVRLVYDTWLGRVIDVFREGSIRNGWARHTGEAAKAYCAAMFSDSVGASMGRKLKPYIGYTGTSGLSSSDSQLWKCDTADPSDNGNTFQCYFESKPYVPWGLGRQGGLTSGAMLVAKANQGTSIQVTYIRDEEAEELIASADLIDESDGGQAVRVFPMLDDSRLGQAKSFRVRVGDAQAVSVAQWLLTALSIPIADQGSA